MHRMLCTGRYAQDVRYFAKEHMDVRREAFQASERAHGCAARSLSSWHQH